MISIYVKIKEITNAIINVYVHNIIISRDILVHVYVYVYYVHILYYIILIYKN